MKPRTILSLLSWDSLIYTRNLLLNLDWAVAGENTHLMILDQGSGEDTKSFIREYVGNRKNATALMSSRNMGYGPGHNFTYKAALAMGPFDYFITVNSDALFCEPGWANLMVSAMEANPDAAIGGPFAYKYANASFNPATQAEMRSGDFMFVTGAVAIIRAAAAKAHGLFDEIYLPAYWEDADMVMRYRHYGWRQLFIDVPVLHGYLGPEGKVSQVKKDALKAEWGDFQGRNMLEFVTRYMSDPPAVAQKDPVTQLGSKLYMP
jgi:GT2 family glycosyltransferase